MNIWFADHRNATLAVVMTVTAACLLGGCATSGNPRDPIEGFNRAIFDINDGLDKTLVKPIAQGYEATLPSPVRMGVTNFFSNIDDVFVAVNNLLQGKVPEALSDVGRVAVNTTIGVLGVMDVATELGLEKHEEDFGQTFGRWGVADGPYLVLPLFGSSTLRDAVGLAIDVNTDPVKEIHSVSTRNFLSVTRAINTRSGYLSADKVVEEAALDRYAYLRDAYLQRRRNRIYDGDPPREKENAAEAALDRPVRQEQEQGYARTYHERVAGSVNLFVERHTLDFVAMSAMQAGAPSVSLAHAASARATEPRH